jgi:hypothetical protein
LRPHVMKLRALEPLHVSGISRLAYGSAMHLELRLSQAHCSCADAGVDWHVACVVYCWHTTCWALIVWYNLRGPAQQAQTLAGLFVCGRRQAGRLVLESGKSFSAHNGLRQPPSPVSQVVAVGMESRSEGVGWVDRAGMLQSTRHHTGVGLYCVQPWISGRCCMRQPARFSC